MSMVLCKLCSDLVDSDEFPDGFYTLKYPDDYVCDYSTGFEWIACPDGKSRPVEPTIRLLAHGVQHRAPILHAFGNAIVPQVAAEFIKATM